MAKIKEVYRTEGTEPACPGCGNWNAMLHHTRNDQSGNFYRDLECRDCAYTLYEGTFNVIVLEYDKMPKGPYLKYQ